MEITPFYCSDHDRYFKNAQGLGSHTTKTHDVIDTALGTEPASPPSKVYCRHITCVPRFGAKSERGLSRHNQYVLLRAIAEGRTVDEQPVEDAAPVESVPAHAVATDGVLVAGGFVSNVDATVVLPHVPADISFIPICARKGNLYVWIDHEWRTFDLNEFISMLRMAVQLS
jgi:hypothetical protein